MMKHGIHVVAGAGNDGLDASVRTPARIEEVITVGASDIKDQLWAKSNHGKVVNIIAPGVDVISCDVNSNSGTKVMSGTSMVS